MAAGAATYSCAEATRLGVTRLRLGLGVKAAFLTDTHTHGFGPVEEQVLDALTRESPDILLHAGDFIDAFTLSLTPVRRYLAQMEAREKYAVLGNHDYWCGRVGELVHLLKEFGYTVLKDSSVASGMGVLLGVDWRDDRAYAHLGDADVVIAHDPNAVLGSSGRLITLAGHTHGGVVVDGVTILSNSLYTRGLYRLSGDRMLYVSRGLGQMVPLRTTSPLELVFLE